MRHPCSEIYVPFLSIDRMAAVPEGKALLDRWRTATDIKEQYDTLEELFKNNIFPSEDHPTWESEGGLYPDPQFPRPTDAKGEWQAWYADTVRSVAPADDFLPKLMRKREFQESLQPPITSLDVDKCRLSEDFQITPVQRFVSRLLSPRTPYNSALLYHGVGVGKTCAAVTVCESYLEMYPDTRVCIIAPPNIQEGFRRTIFDINSLKQGPEGNTHNGCTGNIYLSLTNSFHEKNPKVIDTRVDKAINSRYEFFGYTSFYNHIQRLLKSLEKRKASESIKREVLRNEFSNRIFIVDEAHNLRDNPDEKDEDVRDDANEQETAESRAGKRLTPYLRELLMVCEGITLVLMTATPMYNSYIEIIFLLNLLLLNDKFATLRVSDIFERDGSFTASGERILGKVASYYISFMRGENPLSFPLRLEPPLSQRLAAWPSRDPKGQAIPDVERERLLPNVKAGLDKGGLPCVPCRLTPESEAFYKAEANEIVRHEQGLGIVAMDILIQGGNWIFPVEGTLLREKIGQRGFDGCFQKEKRGSAITFTPHEGEDASWLLRSNIESASGKAAAVLDRLAACKGVSFVYSRFVPSGALTLALALEANGYTLWGRDVGFLSTGIQDDQGRQCALCPSRERGHGGDHAFKPAKYVLLTGSSELSPNNAASIDAARLPKNLYGGEVKVVLGSQVAGEGLDLRYIREVIVFDSWYHLNKLEQVIGRGIRNCSHALLDRKFRNCTIVLLVNSYASDPESETIDMYSYRMALEKAIQAGKVLRVLKEHAIDCSLNKDSILLKGIPPIPSIFDGQGVERKNVDVNDVPFTVMCDWLEECDYGCRSGRGDPMPPPPSLDQQDITTYDEYTARFHIHTIRSYIQDLITKNEYYVTFDKIQQQFETIPRTMLLSILNDMVNRDTFRIKTARGSGRIILRNGYYLFQPDTIADESIPIAIRVRHVPVPRDVFNPTVYGKVKEEKPEAVGEQTFSVLAPADDTSEALWEEVKDWASDISKGDASTSVVPDQVLYELQQLKASSGIYEGQKEKFEKILWLYESIATDAGLRSSYAMVVLKYVWDEYITTAKKRELLAGFSTDPVLKLVAEDSYWTLEGTTYLRVINTETNVLEYLCPEGSAAYTVCSPAIVSVLAREKGRDPLLKTPITTATTGINYGFLIYSPKKRSLVFKKGRPPPAGGKLQRGAECANNSSTSSEIEALKQYGTILRRAGISDMGLNTNELARRTIENSLRVCTVVDLTLRMMDELKVDDKRWFYRCIQSHLVGHPLR